MNNKGFSLPELMIAMGLLGGISLITVKIMENQSNNEAYLKGKAEIQKTTSLIKNLLNNPTTCRALLTDQNIPGTIGPRMAVMAPNGAPGYPTTSGLFQRMAAGGYREILVAGPSGVYRDFRVGTIELERTSETVNNGVNVNLLISYNIQTHSIIFRSDLLGSSRTLNEKIPLTVSVQGNTISSCGLRLDEVYATAKKKFCDSLGNMAEWNAGTNECSFKKDKSTVCPYGTVPKQMNKGKSAEMVGCEDVLTHFKASDIFSTASCPITASGRYSIQMSGGKLRVKCE